MEVNTLFRIEVTEDILSFFVVYLCSLYIFLKALKIKVNAKNMSFALIYGFGASSCIAVLRIYNQTYPKTLFILLTAVSLVIINRKNYLASIPAAIVSIGLSYCLRGVSVIIVVSTLVVLRLSETNIFITILLFAIHILLTLGFMMIKRFKNGFTFFENKGHLGIGLFLSGLEIIFVCLISNDRIIPDTLVVIWGFGIPVCLIGLFIWIRRTIKLHYRKKLKERAEDYYQTLIEEKDKYIEKLTASNEFLSKVVHRDNHLIGSLRYAINDYFKSGDEEEKNRVLREIFTLADERSKLICKEQADNKVLPTTGVSVIDGAIGNMYVKATAHGIDFELLVGNTINYLVGNIISQTELETLLCDHIKDAIIAVEHTDRKGRILVKMNLVDDIFEISIKDNGVPFEIDTLKKLGRERITTHADEGGSGIGFMTTFETMRKCRASLIIEEYESGDYTKTVTFRFDNTNSFIIGSYRREQLEVQLNREDLILI